jgi:hypothetical protein
MSDLDTALEAEANELVPARISVERQHEAKKFLLGQAGALGMHVDGRWSVDTLAEKVLEAQEAKKAGETQAIKDAADTWVFMIRDGWAVEDEKCAAGGTYKVPAWIAKRWYVAGGARPADESEGLAYQAKVGAEDEEFRARVEAQNIDYRERKAKAEAAGEPRPVY